MSFVNKIPRGLRVLVVMLVCAVLIWQFAVDTEYFYYSIGAAVLVTFGAIVLVYRPFKSTRSARIPQNKPAKASETLEVNPLEFENTEILYQSPRSISGPTTPRATVAGPSAGTSAQPPIYRPAAADSASMGRRSASKPGVLNARPPLPLQSADESSPVQDTPPDDRSAAKEIKAEDSARPSFFKRIPRGLVVVPVIAVCAVLIWQFAAESEYFYHSIGVAVLLVLLVIVLLYRPFRSKNSVKPLKKNLSGEDMVDSIHKNASSEDSGSIEIESDYTDTPSILRAKSNQSFRSAASKPEGPDMTRRYTKTVSSETEDSRITKPITGMPQAENVEDETVEPTAAVQPGATNPDGSPAIPLVEDETILTDEDKNQLLNAVWYRCENPFCKYTNFLGVHHIVEEKEGGTNKLDNLIVLCPFCHDLAHRGEIPETEMREWIGNRETRFKFKPNWKYF